MVVVYKKEFDQNIRFKPKESLSLIITGLSSEMNRKIRWDEIVYDPLGKPKLKSGELFFSVSHTQKYFAMAVSKKFQVGLDLEYPGQFLDNSRLESEVYSISEREHVKNFRTHLSFYDIWCIKEATSKVLGLGLRVPFNELSIDFEKELIFAPSEYSHFSAEEELTYKKIDLFNGVISYVVYLREKNQENLVELDKENLKIVEMS